MAAATLTEARPDDGDGGRPATPRRVFVVWNPAAGSKAGMRTNETSEADLRAAMTAHNLGSELFVSPSPEATASRVDAAIAAGYDVIVAAGGDGTARSIASGLLGREAALGMLPLGSAMNLARSLRVPRDLDGAAALIASGRVRAIDVGDVRGQTFYEQVAIGLSADAFAEAQDIDRRRWGAIAGLLRLSSRRRTRIELDLDGEVRHSRALAIAIANAPFTGIGIELAPDAALDDGLLDVVVFEGLSPLGLARYMLKTLFGGEPPQRFRTVRARRVKVTAHRPLSVHFDGQEGGETPVEIEIRPGALRVIAPEARPARH